MKMQVPGLSICQRPLNKNANTQVPYLSKTWAHNLSILIRVFAKTTISYTWANQITKPPDHIWPSQCFWNPDPGGSLKCENANTWTWVVLSQKQIP